ncbi:MAG: hypothetical protein CVV47_04515 [Spirochaetae bacterium HGW-Spirochaetae-3]|nr:MAG: hypothetical protein CVV47_04515 [Spirochaetae bacterium HGW-Spirochaetae-3]
MKNALSLCFSLALALLVAGCPEPFSPGIDIPDDTGDLEENTDLFVEDGGDPGTFVFETNDSAYWSSSGYTLWALDGVAQDTFVSRTVKVYKSSGNSWAGYGLVLCHYDTEDPAFGETMLVAMINNKREYIVGEVASGTFSAFFDWTISLSLNEGEGVPNTIGIVRIGEEFVLSFNGLEAYRFRDDETPLHTRGRDGFIVVISPQDRFPQTPVKVNFIVQ